MRGLKILVVALAVPGLALATPASKPAGAAAKPAAPIPLTPGARRPTLSAEGRAIAQRIMAAPDPRVAQIQAEMAAIRQEKLKLIAGPAIDMERIEALLRREEVLQAEHRARQNDLLLTLLRALPDPDRVVLLQNRANPAKLQNSKPADPVR